MIKVKCWIEDHWGNIISIAGLLIFVLVYVYGPKFLNTFLLDRLDSETTATVLSIEREIIIREDHLGGRVKVGGFTLRYQYDTADSTYQKQEYIDRKSVGRNAERLLVGLKPGDTILVRYNPEDPSIARWLPETGNEGSVNN